MTDTAPPAATETPVADIVVRYIALRDKKAELKAAYEKSVEKIDEAMKRCEAFIMATMDQIGVDSVKTAAGTAFKKQQTSATVADWDATLAFIKDSESWSMLERRVNKTFVEAYIEEHNDLPPGVNYRSETVVNIRRT